MTASPSPSAPIEPTCPCGCCTSLRRFLCHCHTYPESERCDCPPCKSAAATRPVTYSVNDRFGPGLVVVAEGARVMFVTCLTCGVAVLLDPRDEDSAAIRHHEWHKQQSTENEQVQP